MLEVMWGKAGGPEVLRVILTNSTKKRELYIHLMQFGHFIHLRNLNRSLFQPYKNLQELVFVHVYCGDMLEARNGEGIQIFVQVCRRIVLIDVYTNFTFDFNIAPADHVVIPKANVDLLDCPLYQYHETLDQISEPLSQEEEEKIVAYMPGLMETQIQALTSLMTQ